MRVRAHTHTQALHIQWWQVLLAYSRPWSSSKGQGSVLALVLNGAITHLLLLSKPSEGRTTQEIDSYVPENWANIQHGTLSTEKEQLLATC